MRLCNINKVIRYHEQLLLLIRISRVTIQSLMRCCAGKERTGGEGGGGCVLLAYVPLKISNRNSLDIAPPSLQEVPQEDSRESSLTALGNARGLRCSPPFGRLAPPATTQQ